MTTDNKDTHFGTKDMKRKDRRETLYRRIEHLERRVTDNKDNLVGTHYDRAELSSLKWVLDRELESFNERNK